MPVFPSVIPQFQVIDPIATYGCAFDHRVVFDGATTGGTGIITSATANFTTQDIGKRIVLTAAGAGASPNIAMYVGTIQSLNSSSSVNVTPNTTNTASAKGLQIHTDDLQSWTNLITDLNNSVYPGGIIFMREAWTATGFTNRSGISSILPVINKTLQIFGIGGGHTADVGDYTKIGGTCIAYAGTTSDGGVPFSAVMTIQPTVGLTAQALKQVTLSHFWIDCRNGDGPAALKAFAMKSCHGWTLDDVFVMDAGAVGFEFGVVGPGLAVPNAGSLGEAKDFTRGHAINVSGRFLEQPSQGVTVTPTTTTSAITLSLVGQNLVLAAANGLTTSGYVWVMTTIGTPVLVNYTGGGGTTTLTGCTVSAQDANSAYSTVSGANVVQAGPFNASMMICDGDATANTNLSHLDTIIVSHSVNWGPAAFDFRNCDSMDTQNIVINGGNNTNDGAINRIRKPGVRLNGHPSLVNHARNNVFHGGSPGAGGCSAMGVTNAGALIAAQSTANYWHDYQMANGEPIPTVEGNASFYWNPNGGSGLVPPAPSPVLALASGQAIAAATATLLTGSVIPVPPQGLQVGTTYRWTFWALKQAAGIAARTFNVRIGTTGTVADAVAGTISSPAGTAVSDTAIFTITVTFYNLGAGTTAANGQFWMTHNLQTTGWSTTQTQVILFTMTGLSSTTAQQFVSLSVTTGASETCTIFACMAEIVKGANP
jgi:hypothetical protein